MCLQLQGQKQTKPETFVDNMRISTSIISVIEMLFDFFFLNILNQFIFILYIYTFFKCLYNLY